MYLSLACVEGGVNNSTTACDDDLFLFCCVAKCACHTHQKHHNGHFIPGARNSCLAGVKIITVLIKVVLI